MWSKKVGEYQGYCSILTGSKILDFCRTTVFCLDIASENTKSQDMTKIWRGHCPLGPLATPMQSAADNQYLYRFMISCDQCEEWFHGDCVGITLQRGRRMEQDGEEYVCPKCVKVCFYPPQYECSKCVKVCFYPPTYECVVINRQTIRKITHARRAVSRGLDVKGDFVPHVTGNTSLTRWHLPYCWRTS